MLNINAQTYLNVGNSIRVGSFFPSCIWLPLISTNICQQKWKAKAKNISSGIRVSNSRTKIKQHLSSCSARDSEINIVHSHMHTLSVNAFYFWGQFVHQRVYVWECVICHYQICTFDASSVFFLYDMYCYFIFCTNNHRPSSPSSSYCVDSCLDEERKKNLLILLLFNNAYIINSSKKNQEKNKRSRHVLCSLLCCVTIVRVSVQCYYISLCVCMCKVVNGNCFDFVGTTDNEMMHTIQ